MSNPRMTAEPRSEFGKGAARRLRRTGRVPAVIYGDGQELRHISLPGHDLVQALRRPRVVLEIEFEGGTTLVKPRDVQRDPVKLFLEHVDLVVVSAAEARARGAMAEAIAAAEAAADEAGIDRSAAVRAVEEAVAAGEDPMAAAAHAVEDARRAAQEMADAAAAAAAAEDAAEAAEAALGVEGEAAPAAESSEE